MVSKIKNKEQVIDKFLKKFSVLNDSGYNEYDLYLDMGKYRVEIKHKDKMLYYMEYLGLDKGIMSNEIRGSKMFSLLEKLLINYYDLKGI